MLTQRRFNVAHRQQRWSNLQAKLVQRLVFAGVHTALTKRKVLRIGPVPSCDANE